MPKIFDNPTILTEKIDDITLSRGQIEEAARLKTKIDDWKERRDNIIVAYVGKFGSGKSATLSEAERLYRAEGSQILWLNFEAWRYADRTKLWDGFVLEVADAIGGKKVREKAKSKIDGIQELAKHVYEHPVNVFTLVVGVWLIVSVSLWFLALYKTDEWILFYKALLKYALPSLFALLALAGVSTLFRSKPAPLTRVEELEQLLDSSLKKLKKPLVVVAEDVDRAGEEGIIFLETLSNFLNNQGETNEPVIVIAPQDITYMSALNSDKIKGLDRSIKIYNSAVYYGSSVLSDEDVEQLLDEAKISQEYKDALLKTIKQLLHHYRNQLSMRMIKFILRELHEFSESEDRIDPDVAAIFILIRYIKHQENGSSPTTILQAFNNASLSNIHLGILSSGIAPTVKLLNALAGITQNVTTCQIEFAENVDFEIDGTITNERAVGTVTTKVTINNRYQALLK